MALLFKSDSDRIEWWRRELGERMPEVEVRCWPEVGDPKDIEFALVWNMPRGALARFPNLRVIFSLGAGVDHLFADPELPKQVPICRAVDEFLTQRMNEYVALHVLRYHRRQPELEELQRRGEWKELYTPTASERGIGIMGLGALGANAAKTLAALDFKMAGWSRTPKRLEGVESFHGPTGLAPFLARSEILVCLLPLTRATEGILSSALFAGLPKGAAVINAARGKHLVEADLLKALASGQLAYAALDVYQTEPLPPEHPFWRHPRITISPHIASITDPRTTAALVAENVRRYRAGEPLLYTVDAALGY
ncbi:MAG TPA: glyoxylate/hydroxypyruvate reductase A [Alphaproteobacteria bacterium]|nr:glyoxylate/hydroxypyruvate reductase A [Alphaproteobacteria bacterium]